MADNIARDGGDRVLDLTAVTGHAARFSAAAVMDAAGTLGDQRRNVPGDAIHSDVYRPALKSDVIETVQESAGRAFPTFRGLRALLRGRAPQGGPGTMVGLVARRVRPP